MKRSKFKYKLAINITLIISTIIFLSFLLYGYHTSKNLKTNEVNNSRIILENISTQIDLLYNEMDTAISSLVYNPQLKNSLYTINNSDISQSSLEFIQQKKIIESNLGTVLFFPNISNIFLYNSKKDYFYYSGYYLNNYNHIKKTLSNNTYINNLNDYSSRVMLGPHISPWSPTPTPVISVYGNFTDNLLLKDSIIEAQIPYNVVDNICTQNSFENNKEIIIFDNNFNVVYPLKKNFKFIDDKKLNNIKKNLNKNIYEDYSKTYNYLMKKSDSTNLNIMLVSNNSYINKQNFDSLVLTFIITLIILCATLGICFFIFKKLLDPLHELIDYINSGSKTKLSIKDNGIDEFKIINNSFNNMLDELKDSMSLAYESQIKEMEASFTALQAQVNPHFLYNTLNSISAASDIYGSEVTQKMCQELSLMMRYITSKHQDTKLINEINHTRNYLELMKISHVDAFDYEINIDIEAYDLIIPKLTIQPLVENCFKHAFSTCTPPWHISINCELIDGCYKVTIVDNGVGFTEKALGDLNDFIKKYEVSKYLNSYKDLSIGGLGIKNIYSRLAIFYEGNFSFKVSYDNGCKITIERMINID
ncbi:HAMP domain-containing protein [Romboutsia weinsteinii]|uniref:HAMP domain-containing protein n=1 Tax=Romboutsia weinsteinii TaxID=2020949 RepID=A0A371J8N4_9FIRM|nr:histidine kinase [Romboutsia weinsteinii]RDY29140.1 HAMP domain-containing protein [Romboutsia weinsteinii]